MAVYQYESAADAAAPEHTLVMLSKIEGRLVSQFKDLSAPLSSGLSPDQIVSGMGAKELEDLTGVCLGFHDPDGDNGHSLWGRSAKTMDVHMMSCTRKQDLTNPALQFDFLW